MVSSLLVFSFLLFPGTSPHAEQLRVQKFKKGEKVCFLTLKHWESIKKWYKAQKSLDATQNARLDQIEARLMQGEMVDVEELKSILTEAIIQELTRRGLLPTGSSPTTTPPENTPPSPSTSSWKFRHLLFASFSTPVWHDDSYHTVELNLNYAIQPTYEHFAMRWEMAAGFWSRDQRIFFEISAVPKLGLDWELLTVAVGPRLALRQDPKNINTMFFSICPEITLDFYVNRVILGIKMYTATLRRYEGEGNLGVGFQIGIDM